jgi:L-asparaginase II
VLATVIRSGVVEAWHDGAVAVVGPDGRGIARTGETDRSYFIRSAAKPVQASVATTLGVEISPEETAVAAASHDGEPIHQALVSSILSRHRLDESDLRCPPSWPLSAAARRRVIGAGHRRPRRLWHNCSGKHAAMLAACVVQGWPTATYLDAHHPLQVRIAAEMERIFGPATTPLGVDGCGAPVFRCTTASVARGFAALLDDDASRGVVDAMCRFPALASGERNVDAAIAIILGGLAKRGAEGLLAVGLPGRGALAIKIWDGSARPVGPVAASVLDRVGWVPDGSRPALECALASRVLGGEQEVGGVTPTGELETW